MQAMVVYESMYGNTRDIAEQIGLGLGGHFDTHVLEVGEAPAAIPPDVQLVVIGGPTHAFTMSKPETRESAAKDADGPLVSPGIGIREWIDGLEVSGDRVRFATFDTKIRRPRIPGSAAKAATKQLRRKGCTGACPSMSFQVEGSLGPISDGELERARAWGAEIAVGTEHAVLA